MRFVLFLTVLCSSKLINLSGTFSGLGNSRIHSFLLMEHCISCILILFLGSGIGHVNF